MELGMELEWSNFTNIAEGQHRRPVLWLPLLFTKKKHNLKTGGGATFLLTNYFEHFWGTDEVAVTKQIKGKIYMKCSNYLKKNNAFSN